MIKANELRLGNWLTFFNLIEPKKYFEVDGRFLFNLTKYDAISQYYQPIPLTPEILERAGFSYREFLDDYFIKVGRLDCILIITKSEMKICASNQQPGYFPPVNYVHQLQNLFFALTNKELEINITHLYPSLP